MNNIDKKNFAVIATVILILAAGVFYFAHKQNKISYENDFPGIPIYQDARLVQNGIIKDEKGSTQGKKVYVVDDYAGDVNSAVKYMEDNLDTAEWTITENKNPSVDSEANKVVRQLWIKPVSNKTDSVILLILSSYDNKLFINLTAINGQNTGN